MIDKNNLEKSIQYLIDRLKNNGSIEENKIEIKRQWYDLKSPQPNKLNISEFLKDITSIANTPGPDGYLIIGIDDKNGNVFDSPFKNSGLKDISDIKNIIVKHVRDPFDAEFKEITTNDKALSIFIIPPSISKPHVIKQYITEKQNIENYIPIRKLTSIYAVNKDDLELMYYDRKNIEPEYALEIKSYKPALYFEYTPGSPITANLECCFENYGRKPIALVMGQLLIQHDDFKHHKFNLYTYKDFGLSIEYQKQEFTIRHHYLVVPSNNIKTVAFKFNLQNSSSYDQKTICETLNKIGFKFSIICVDINKKQFLSNEMERKASP